MSELTPVPDSDRLAAVQASGLFGTPPEREFDEIVRLVARICGTPMAALSLVAADRQWFKASVGLQVCETARGDALCAQVIMNPHRVFVVEDARAHPELAHSVLVTGEPYIRFYAGAPLVNTAGLAIGALCVMAPAPRTLDADQLESLQILARQVMHLVEARRLAVKLAELKSAVDHHAIVAMADPAGRLTYVNDRFCAITGFDRAALLNPARTLDTAAHPGHPFFGPAWPTITRSDIFRGEVHGQSRDGNTYWVEGTLVPLRNPGGQPAQFLFIGTDISERKRDELELGRAREAALEAVRLRSRFLANMSHELRTPLNTINGVTATLLEQSIPEPMRAPLALILQCGEALLQNIQTILTHSSLESGKFTLEAQPFCPADVALAALRIAGEKARRKGVDLDYYQDAAIPAMVVGDAFRLQQVLVNLLSNGIKFTDAGRVSLRVRAQALADGRAELRFLVADTGIGISRANLGRLFTPFSQADNSGTRRHEGTGLGLVISKTLVELMGGRLRVRSRPEIGSVFQILVPFQPAPGHRSLGAATAHASLAGRRILIVEPRAPRRRQLLNLTHAWGMRPAVATNAAAAALRVTLQRFDVAIRAAPVGDPPGERDSLPLPMLWLCPPGRAPVPGAERSASIAEPFGAEELSAALVSLLAAPAAPVPVAAAPRRLGERIPLKILSVDDVATNREMLKIMCHHLGYDTELVTNGTDALARIYAGRYDLVLLDVNMPGRDGLSVAREICERFPNPADRPRLVAITANALMGDRERCLAAGMDEYLSKPLIPQQLVACIERLFAENAGALEDEFALPTRAGAPTVDREHLLAISVDLGPEMSATLIQQLHDSVRRDYVDLRPRIAEACLRRDAAELRALVHGLKGCVLTTGLTRMGQHCQEVLQALAEQRFTGWDALDAQLHRLFTTGSAELLGMLASPGPAEGEPAPQPVVTAS